MTIGQALVAHAGPYMLAAKARALVEAEVSKGCEAELLPGPVALEPVFAPLAVPRDIMALQNRPCWVYEDPPAREDLMGLRVWTSPDQPFSWECFELFLKQLCLVSHRVGLEIVGNQERIAISAIANVLSDFSLCLSRLRP